jgi:NCS1 family nucleobase:cation symporter-1
VTIAWFGYRAIAAFERWTVPPTLAVLVLMSVVAWVHLHIDWSYAGPTGHVLHGGERIAAMSAVMTVIGIGWGITWFTYACDYSRFVSKTVSRRKLYLVSTLGQFIPVVWLGVLGASLATTNGSVDPGKLIVSNYGALALPVLFLVIHGPIATNILNIYTFSVAAQALDINVNRRKLNLFVGVFALAVVIFFIFQSSLATVLSTWLGAIVAWIASWAGIMLVHYFVIEKGQLRAQRLFDPVGSRRLPDVNWATMVCFAVGIVATWMFMYGATGAMQGLGARALGGLDLSWLAGSVVAATLYAVLGPRTRRHHQGTLVAAAVHETSPASQREALK